MVKLIKLLLWVVAIGVVVLVAAAVAIPYFVDPNEYKPQIQDLVKDKTGHRLTINGDIELSFIPWLGLTIGATRIDNPPGFDAPVLAAFQQGKVSVNVWPLLSKRLELDTISLQGFELNLQRRADGFNNYQSPSQQLGEPPAKAKPATVASDPPSMPFKSIELNGIDLKDGTIVWDDALSEPIELSGISVRTGPLKLDEAFTVQTKATLNLPARSFQREIDFFSSVAVDLDQSQLALTDLTVSGLVDLTGTVRIDQFHSAPAITGTISIADLNPRQLLNDLAIELPDTADPTVLSKAALDVQFQIRPPAVTVDHLAGRLDESALTGSFSIDAEQRIALKADIDRLNLDRYLPAPSANKATVETPGTQTAKTAAAGDLPLDLFRTLQLTGEASIGHLTVTNLNVKSIRLPVKVDGGQLESAPEAALYEGIYRGHIMIDAREAEPLIAIDERLSDVQAGPLLRDLSGKTRISGTASANAKLKMQGANAERIQATLNGGAAFEFRDGAVSGINIGRMLREAQAKVKGEPLAADNEALATDFSELSASVTVVNGRIKNSDLNAKSPLLRVSGEGFADLPGQSVDYSLTVALVKSAAGQGGEDLSELRGIPIPIRIEGALTEPNIGLDISAIVQNRAQQLVDKETDKLVDKVREKIDDKLGQELGEQLGGEAGDALKEGASKLLEGLLNR